MTRTFFFSFFLFFTGTLCAEEGPPQPPSRDQGLMQTMLMIAIAGAFFYFILWRPEQQRRKEMEDARGALKKGDRVTAMGILGTVSRVSEHTVVLRMVDGAKIEMLKSAITDFQSMNGEESAATSDAG